MPDVETWKVIFAGTKEVLEMFLKIVTAITLPILVWLGYQNNVTINKTADKTDAVVTGVEAGVKSWKAFNSKEPEAVAEAEQIINAADRELSKAGAPNKTP